MLELIKAIYKNELIGSYDDDNAAKVLARELQRVQDIKSAVANLSKDIVRILKEKDEEAKSLLNKIQEIRKTCRHETTYYNSDPSGNGDSYTECTICGANL